MEAKKYTPVLAPKKPAAHRPEFAFRVNGVSVSGFRNQADDGREFFRFAVQRSYRDAEGNFQATSSFDLADLPVLVKLLEQAFAAALGTPAATDIDA